MFQICERDGDEVCIKCGTIQNIKSLQSSNAEYRVFSDDNKSSLRIRADVSCRDRIGGVLSLKPLRLENATSHETPEKSRQLETDLE